jgi:hypothetical protein
MLWRGRLGLQLATKWQPRQVISPGFDRSHHFTGGGPILASLHRRPIQRRGTNHGRNCISAADPLICVIALGD